MGMIGIHDPSVEAEAVDFSGAKHPLGLWRTVPACEFGPFASAVAACVAEIAIGGVEWRRAAAGDAATAVRIAFRAGVPARMTWAVDAAMTVLVHNALNGNAGAAVVLAHLLRRMPLETTLKNRLATSWLVHSFPTARGGIVSKPGRRSLARRTTANRSSGVEECGS